MKSYGWKQVKARCDCYICIGKRLKSKKAIRQGAKREIRDGLNDTKDVV